VSIEAVHWALSVPVGGNLKVVLIGIANHANPDGTEAYPSMERLGVYAHCDPRTAQRNLRKLEFGGWVIDDGIGPGGKRRWRLAMGRQIAAPANRRPDENVAPGGGIPATQTVPSNRPGSGKPSPKRARVRLSDERLAALSDDQRRVVRALRDVAERKDMGLDEEAAIEACLRPAVADRDHAHEAEQLRSWHLEGRGVNSRQVALTAAWRNWLRRAEPANQIRARNGGHGRAAEAQRRIEEWLK
jgi:hypothetical protein